MRHVDAKYVSTEQRKCRYIVSLVHIAKKLWFKNLRNNVVRMCQASLRISGLGLQKSLKISYSMGSGLKETSVLKLFFSQVIGLPFLEKENVGGCDLCVKQIVDQSDSMKMA